MTPERNDSAASSLPNRIPVTVSTQIFIIVRFSAPKFVAFAFGSAAIVGALAQLAKKMQKSIFLLVVMQFCASVDFSTLDNKVLFGYQGWFSHPKDGSAAGWRHWAPGVVPNGKTVSFDLWPDVSEYNSQDLCATDLHFANGETAYLFSSYRAGVVNKHFEWMQQVLGK